MAKVYFYYGAMGSAKSANALMRFYNFKEKGKNPILLKSEIDTRDGTAIIKSRIGLESKCTLLKDFIDLYINNKHEIEKYDFIVLDEAQFATKEQIDYLTDVADYLDIPVYCYGLRTDFKNKLFSGSERLLTLADVVEEIKTVCWCGKDATCNARYNEHGMVIEGKQVELGANDKYVSVCRKHFKLGQLFKPE